MEGSEGFSVQGVRDGIESESTGLIGIGIGSADIGIGRTAIEVIEAIEVIDTDRDQGREIGSLTETESASVNTAGDAHGQEAGSGAIETETVDVTAIVLADQMMILTADDTEFCSLGTQAQGWRWVSGMIRYTLQALLYFLSTLGRFYTKFVCVAYSSSWPFLSLAGKSGMDIIFTTRLVQPVKCCVRCPLPVSGLYCSQANPVFFHSRNTFSTRFFRSLEYVVRARAC
jgi:hypothetical protein